MHPSPTRGSPALPSPECRPECQGISPALPAAHQAVQSHLPKFRVLPHIQKFRTGIALVDRKKHTSELQSLMRISYAVFCLKKTKTQKNTLQNLNSINESVIYL